MCCSIVYTKCSVPFCADRRNGKLTKWPRTLETILRNSYEFLWIWSKIFFSIVIAEIEIKKLNSKRNQSFVFFSFALPRHPTQFRGLERPSVKNTFFLRGGSITLLWFAHFNVCHLKDQLEINKKLRPIVKSNDSFYECNTYLNNKNAVFFG